MWQRALTRAAALASCGGTEGYTATIRSSRLWQPRVDASAVTKAAGPAVGAVVRTATPGACIVAAGAIVVAKLDNIVFV
jgi:hypothetical protein